MKFSVPNVIELAQTLIACASITPDDKSCQTILTSYLKPAGFSIEKLRFDDVDNLWAKQGTEEPVLVLAGHTDVVPPGPLEDWISAPFLPTIREGYLYGRGAADMKGSLAAMLCAALRFVQDHPQHRGTIAFLITSDEEGLAINGTRKVIEYLLKQNEKLTWCIVGEPSSEQVLGDTIKIGRRGSLSGKLRIFGKQGHIAYPHLAENPIHRSLATLTMLVNTVWDNGNEIFQPTSFQISNIQAGVGASNVIPGHLDVAFNFRYSPEVTLEDLQRRTVDVLDQQQLRYEITWNHSGSSFQTPSDELLFASQQAVLDVMQIKPQLSTSGGTSDGRFIATTGCQVVEIGPCNDTIHQVNEKVAVEDLIKLENIYYRIMCLLLA